MTSPHIIRGGSSMGKTESVLVDPYVLEHYRRIGLLKVESLEIMTRLIQQFIDDQKIPSRRVKDEETSSWR
jgi:hypothetical protein